MINITLSHVSAADIWNPILHFDWLSTIDATNPSNMLLLCGMQTKEKEKTHRYWGSTEKENQMICWS